MKAKKLIAAGIAASMSLKQRRSSICKNGDPNASGGL